MATLEELADEYLRTPDGHTGADPCGEWCGDGDVTVWRSVVLRVRSDLTATIRANKGVAFPPELMPEVVRWAFAAGKFKPGNITHIFGAGTDEVIGLVAFARRGVQLMFDVQTIIEEQGGTIKGPGPVVGTYPGSDDLTRTLLYVGGGALLVLVLLQLWKSR